MGGLLPELVSPADGGAPFPLDEVQVGTLLLVKPGSRVPVDGTVVSGASSVDESMLTGEGIPVLKEEGARVSAGTSNRSGAFTVRADALPEDCTAAQLTQLIGRSQSEQVRQLGSARTGQIPLATSQIPLATSQIPLATSQIPLATSQIPLATSQIPLAPHKSRSHLTDPTHHPSQPHSPPLQV